MSDDGKTSTGLRLPAELVGRCRGYAERQGGGVPLAVVYRQAIEAGIDALEQRERSLAPPAVTLGGGR